MDSGQKHVLILGILGDDVIVTNVKLIRAEYYGPQVEWDLDQVLEHHNSLNNSKYTRNDIVDVWVKWNTLHIEFSDGSDLEHEGDYDWEIDTKRPRELRGIDAEGEVDQGRPYGYHF